MSMCNAHVVNWGQKNRYSLQIFEFDINTLGKFKHKNNNQLIFAFSTVPVACLSSVAKELHTVIVVKMLDSVDVIRVLK